MRLILRRSTTIWTTAIIIAVILCTSLLVFVYGRADAQNESIGRLITIHDRGQATVILSEAETIGDALEDADVMIDSRDAVEPVVTKKLVASEYQVNIYRARPVTVIDGSTRQKVMTPYQTAEQIVQDTGITLYSEDTTIIQRSDNLLADGAGLELTIDRATLFSFTLYGKTSETRTQAVTVGEMLKEKKVTLGADDRASIPMSTKLTAGMEVQVWREGTQTITVEEAVGFETEQIRDANRDVGYRTVQTAGVEGKRNATYEIDIRDGKEVARTEIASIVTTQPSRQNQRRSLIRAVGLNLSGWRHQIFRLKAGAMLISWSEKKVAGTLMRSTEVREHVDLRRHCRVQKSLATPTNPSIH